MRNNRKLNNEAMEKLDKKYNLLEKGCLSVSTFLKNKIQIGSIKFKILKTRCNNNGTTSFLKTTNSSCTRS